MAGTINPIETKMIRRSKSLVSAALTTFIAFTILPAVVCATNFFKMAQTTLKAHALRCGKYAINHGTVLGIDIDPPFRKTMFSGRRHVVHVPALDLHAGFGP